jgi:hypothetical protein
MFPIDHATETFALRTLKRKLPLCISLSPRISFRFAAVC